MKTLFCYSEYSDLAQFFILEGDYSHLHRVVINATAPKGVDEDTYSKLQDELYHLLHDSNHKFKHTLHYTPPKNWDVFVNVGVAPY
jgi:hypothetical protein